jgi:hypothetical protein
LNERYDGGSLPANESAPPSRASDVDHLFPCREYDHVRVVDHHALVRATPVTQGIGQKHFAVEALECRIHLEEQHARIAEHGRSGLRRILLAADFDGMR